MAENLQITGALKATAVHERLLPPVRIGSYSVPIAGLYQRKKAISTLQAIPD